ncbi:helix-turn-helix transcriptional regulator [Gordonia sp. ABSL1-1]|uniref:helix-turn-helix transcriptional regulator n=1 Tax=Gordonia sp. ABSL1-1 TaxID=3053923 RepID=UPI002573A6C5|nr:helix-turn-helix transcriptional regulator [Gordonia sp. ABSL1-1]MDL9936324.1 helix-turn-helix transcriptional regulator [Gordonia sp. ABSL1-1]
MDATLGEFLRTRRRQAVAPVGERRRTPGLRREEVATAAAVSHDYYTRLEQGRERNPSDDVLAAIGDSLGFGPDDHAYARALRDRPGIGAGIDIDAARMSRLVESLRPNPAYVLDQVSNVVAINSEGAELFTGLMDHPRPNTCRYLLTDPRARERFVDWEDNARRSVAALRAANADVADPGLDALTTELSAASTTFGEWWASFAVAPRRADAKRFRDTDGRVITYPYESLRLPDPGLRMTVYLAAACQID